MHKPTQSTSIDYIKIKDISEKLLAVAEQLPNQLPHKDVILGGLDAILEEALKVQYQSNKIH